MNEIDKTNLTVPAKFKLNEINKTKKYFNSEIQEKKPNSKKLNKYVAAFDYIDKVLIAFSATSGGVFIISSVSVARASIGIAGASLTLISSLTTEIITKLLSITKNKTIK